MRSKARIWTLSCTWPKRVFFPILSRKCDRGFSGLGFKSRQSILSFCSQLGPSQFSSVQSLSRVRRFATPWIAAHQASLSITNSRSSPKLMCIESVMPSSHLILCHPLLLLAPVPPSIRVFSNESTLCMRWPKYWSFNLSISPSNEHPGLVSFRMDWLDLLAVQRTLKSLLQHHSSKASILQCSAIFTVQLSHPYMTTGKTIALTRQTFVDKVISLLLNMLSRLVITFLPRSKCPLISWLQSLSAVILEPPKIKSDTVSTVSPSICHEVVGPDAMIFVFWMLSFKPTVSLSSFTFIKRLFSSSSLLLKSVSPVPSILPDLAWHRPIWVYGMNSGEQNDLESTRLWKWKDLTQNLRIFTLFLPATLSFFEPQVPCLVRTVFT